MNERPGFFRKAASLLAGKGFYMVLLLCLVILGASGYFLYQTMAGLTIQEPVNAQAEITVPNDNQLEVTAPVEDVIITPVEEPAETITEPEISEVIEPVPEDAEPVIEEPEPQPVIEPVEEVVVPVAKPVLGWPVVGDIVAAFSATELTYNEVLGDWRTHGGVDISADVGTEVLAATAGSVTAITNDPVTGTTLTLDHGDGLVTVYGNLNGDTLCVAEGEQVEAGAILGCVGSTGDQTAPCLHFAILEDGTSVDPEEYIG